MTQEAEKAGGQLQTSPTVGDSAWDNIEQTKSEKGVSYNEGTQRGLMAPPRRRDKIGKDDAN